MKTKKTIIDKTVYGGTLVDKYFFIFDDGTDMQVPLRVWDEYEVGNIFHFEDVPDEFKNAMDDIEEGRTVPLDKALNEEPPSESVEKICKQIEEIYRENEYLKLKCHILETANDELDLEVKRLKGNKS